MMMGLFFIDDSHGRRMSEAAFFACILRTCQWSLYKTPSYADETLNNLIHDSVSVQGSLDIRTSISLTHYFKT